MRKILFICIFLLCLVCPSNAQYEYESDFEREQRGYLDGRMGMPPDIEGITKLGAYYQGYEQGRYEREKEERMEEGWLLERHQEYQDE